MVPTPDALTTDEEEEEDKEAKLAFTDEEEYDGCNGGKKCNGFGYDCWVSGGYLLGWFALLEGATSADILVVTLATVAAAEDEDEEEGCGCHEVLGAGSDCAADNERVSAI